MNIPQDLRYKLLDKLEKTIDDSIDANLDRCLSGSIDTHLTNNIWRKLVKSLHINLKETSEGQTEEMLGEIE